jgi:3-dehydroquinate dehydratase-2
LADRLAGLSLPFVEAHVSDLSKREDFRQRSFLKRHAIEVIQGLGIQSYWVALQILVKYLDGRRQG